MKFISYKRFNKSYQVLYCIWFSFSHLCEIKYFLISITFNDSYSVFLLLHIDTASSFPFPGLQRSSQSLPFQHLIILHPFLDVQLKKLVSSPACKNDHISLSYPTRHYSTQFLSHLLHSSY